VNLVTPAPESIPSAFDVNLKIWENQDRVRNVDQVTPDKKVKEDDFDLNYLAIALSARGSSQLSTPQSSPEKIKSTTSPYSV
jgi:hypothetical protein